ncbi:hypothetical protein EU348_10240 [Chryseobacterium indologenes]|uniref:Uncharacterized protein n=1 Tax=Chryseobacterium indologenes TaxID=253 RepID=A0A411DME4_CHRID|nr:hypothetical protein EU348_10240 [Chryseobacterium indologenes]
MAKKIKLSELLSFFTVIENAKIKLKKYNTQAGKEESIKIDFMKLPFYIPLHQWRSHIPLLPYFKENNN